MTHSQSLRLAAVAVIAGGGLAFMNSLAPLQWPTVLDYSGLVILLSGVLSVLVPPRWLGFRKRVHGPMVGFLAGAALLTAGWFWPVPSFHTPSPESRLDAFMPKYNFHERHETVIQASPERVREVLDQVSLADIGVMKTLGEIRALAMRQPVEAASKGAPPAKPFLEILRDPRSGFFPLDDTPREVVFGIAGQPWNNRAFRLKPGEFREWAPPENIKVAANFLIEDAGNGCSRVITETRIAAPDESGRRKMGRYWALGSIPEAEWCGGAC